MRLDILLLLFFFLNAYYSQNLRARWEPGQNINVDTGDGAAHPLAALAHGRAGIDSLRRSGAGTQAEERKQRARYLPHCWIGLRDKVQKATGAKFVTAELHSVSKK